MPIDPAVVQELERLVEAKIAPIRARREEQEAILSRLDRVEAAIERLAEAQQKIEARIEALAARMELLASRMDSLASRMEALAEAQRKTEEALQRLGDKVGIMSGKLVAMEYRSRLPSYLGRRLRRVRVIDHPAMEDELAAHLPEDEQDEVIRVDNIASGRPKESPDRELWLAIDVSAVVDRHDVERCVRRASLLKKLGHPSLPVVAGDSLTKGADERAEDEKVAVLLGGRILNWERAIAAALAG